MKLNNAIYLLEVSSPVVGIGEFGMHDKRPQETGVRHNGYDLLLSVVRRGDGIDAPCRDGVPSKLKRTFFGREEGCRLEQSMRGNPLEMTSGRDPVSQGFAEVSRPHHCQVSKRQS